MSDVIDAYSRHVPLAGQRSLFEEDKHPRESQVRGTHKPGQFAPKSTTTASTLDPPQAPRPRASSKDAPRSEEQVVKDHMGLVTTAGRRYFNGRNNEDLKQVGAEALLRAHRDFDPEKGVKFSTFAFRYIQQAMLNETKKESRRGRAGNMAPTEDGGDGMGEVEGKDPSPDAEAEQNQLLSVLGDLMKDLPESDSRILMDYYGGKTQAEIAASEGVSQQTINHRVQKSISLLREKMGDSVVQYARNSLEVLLERYARKVAPNQKNLFHQYRDEEVHRKPFREEQHPREVENHGSKHRGQFASKHGAMAEVKVVENENGSWSAHVKHPKSLETTSHHGDSRMEVMKKAHKHGNDNGYLVKEPAIEPELDGLFTDGASTQESAIADNAPLEQLPFKLGEYKMRTHFLHVDDENIEHKLWAKETDDGKPEFRVRARDLDAGENISITIHPTMESARKQFTKNSGRETVDAIDDPNEKPLQKRGFTREEREAENRQRDSIVPEEEPFKLLPPEAPKKVAPKFDGAIQGAQGSLFDAGRQDLEGQNLLFNTDPGNPDDPNTMESKMRAELSKYSREELQMWIDAIMSTPVGVEVDRYLRTSTLVDVDKYGMGITGGIMRAILAAIAMSVMHSMMPSPDSSGDSSVTPGNPEAGPDIVADSDSPDFPTESPQSPKQPLYSNSQLDSSSSFPSPEEVLARPNNDLKTKAQNDPEFAAKLNAAFEKNFGGSSSSSSSGSTDKRNNGQADWITIGGHSGKDGAKHAGGTAVQVEDDGDIVKGPDGLKGKDLDDLSSESRNDERNPRSGEGGSNDSLTNPSGEIKNPPSEVSPMDVGDVAAAEPESNQPSSEKPVSFPGQTRAYRAGMNSGTIGFESEKQKDQYDWAANDRYQPSGRTDRRAKRPDNAAEMASRHGVSEEEWRNQARDTFDHIKQQLKGFQDGEHRVLAGSVQEPEPESAVDDTHGESDDPFYVDPSAPTGNLARQQSQDVKNKQEFGKLHKKHRDEINSAAEFHGIDPVELHAMANEIAQQHTDEWEIREGIRKHFNAAMKTNRRRMKAQQSGKGRYNEDFSEAVTGMDEILEDFRSNNPHAQSYSDSDIQNILLDGVQDRPTVSHPDVLNQAVQAISQKTMLDDPDSLYKDVPIEGVPFSRNFDVNAVLERFQRVRRGNSIDRFLTEVIS